jgi:hypothetical protein
VVSSKYPFSGLRIREDRSLRAILRQGLQAVKTSRLQTSHDRNLAVLRLSDRKCLRAARGVSMSKVWMLVSAIELASLSRPR